ncbi:MAG: hypothetical protein AABZ65_00475 [Candidatus Omnitrophota bacterium]
MSNTMFMISSVITAIATTVIALFSWRSFCLSGEIKKATENQCKKEEDFKSQTKDLYQAIVISNILSGPSSYGALTQAIDAFKSQYKGTFKIFD